MKLNLARKIVLIAYCAIVSFLCFICVPFRYVTVYGQTIGFSSYAPLWNTPQHSQGYLAVDITRLCIEIIGVTLITGVVFVLFGEKHK